MSEPERIRNVTGAEPCDWCEYGLVVVGHRPAPNGHYLEYGPCPHCQRGAITEFPTGAKGPKGEPGARPSWGPLGYWRGRPPVIEKAVGWGGDVLSRQENVARSKILWYRYGGMDADPLVALDNPDAAERMGAIADELARIAAEAVR